MVRNFVDDRDFTASAYVRKDNKVLLIEHGKLGKWLPPGGHIEDRETPEETAKRECLEETGFEINILFSNDAKSLEESENLPKPVNINLHEIKNGHYHCDFAYVCEIVSKEEATHADEHQGTKWFTMQEIQSEDYNIPENVRITAKKILS